MIYFTSDTHLGHANIINLCDRPFKNVEEMDNKIINNINETVKEDDTLYILGDFTMYRREDAIKYRERIVCKNCYLIYGNHDKSFDLHRYVWKDAKHYHTLSYNKQKFVLFHYPIESWDGMYKGSIHLHGHIHSRNNAYNIKNKHFSFFQYDVGVDANDFKPVSAKNILDFFSKSIINHASM